MRAALLVAAVFATTSLHAQDKHTLKFQPAPGSSHRLRTTVELITTQSVQGNQSTINNLMMFDTFFEVQDRDAAGITSMTATIENLSVKVEGGGNATHWNSKDPKMALPPALRPYGAVPGLKYRVRIGTDGKVHGVEGLNEAIAAAFADAEEAERDRLIASLEYHFGEKAMKALMESQTHIFPGSPVAKGDTWTTRYESQGVIPGDVTMTMRLLGVNNGVASMMVEQQIKALEAPPALRVQGLEARVALNGKAESLYRMRAQDGLVQFSSLTLDFRGTMSVQGGEEPMEVPLRIAGSISFNLI